MVCFHKRADLGDEHDYEDKNEFIYDLLRKVFKSNAKVEEIIERENERSRTEMEADNNLFESISHKYVVKKLYLYQHGGMTMSLNPFHCPWDSGVVGWIYVDKKKAQKEYKLLSNERIECEVDLYDKYIRGNVYAYLLFEDDDVVDGCSGFFNIEDVYKECPEFSA